MTGNNASQGSETGAAAHRPIIVHSLAHARAALSAAASLGVPAVLLSAPGAAGYLGVGGFQAMIRAARAEHPDVPLTAVLDCADAPGHALAALRVGMTAVAFHGPPAVADKIADIARQTGAVLWTDDAPALDLLYVEDPEQACREWLAAE